MLCERPGGIYAKSTQVPDNERNVDTALKMVKHNFCVTVYGDTDSIFTFFDSSHLKDLGQPMRVAWCGIVAAFAAFRITQYLRSLNKFKPTDEQWMELEYEKTYRFWILFSKKRYAGEMAEWDPFSYSEDKKGVALKRRDFCSFVKETYSKILKAIFNDDGTITRDKRIGDALEVVRRAVEDLLNNRVPFDKLIISKLLKGHYKIAEKKQTKQTKKAQTADFGPHNIYIDDIIHWKMMGVTCKGIVTKKRKLSFFNTPDVDTRSPLSVNITKIIPATPGQPIPHGLAPKMNVNLQYADIQARGASVIHLSKILDPKTPEVALEPIKFPHVRLTRRMFLRDPATAPPSGSRVPYVFCEPDNPNVLQYLRAENPNYAQANGMKVDPVYYLEKQCANAWGQILDTACPGLVQSIFREAYDCYSKRSNNQPELKAFLDGSYKHGIKQITLYRDDAESAIESMRKRTARTARTTGTAGKPKIRKRAAVEVGNAGQTSIASFFSKTQRKDKDKTSKF